MVQAFDLKAKRMVNIVNPRTVTKRTRNGTRTFIMGTSAVTGGRVSRIVGRRGVVGSGKSSSRGQKGLLANLLSGLNAKLSVE